MKFFCLVITNDLHIKKMYIDAEMVEYILMNSSTHIKVYRTSTDQEAMLVDGELVWKDVVEQTKT